MTGGVEELLGNWQYCGPATGSQVFARVRGAEVLDVAVGNDHAAQPLTPAHLVSWACCSKIPLALGAAVALDRAGLTEDVHVAELLPWYRAGGKERVQLKHVLSHTVAYDSWGARAGGPERSRNAEYDLAEEPWPAVFDAIAAATLVSPPGESVAYCFAVNSYVVAAVIEALSGMAWETFLACYVLGPLGMEDCSLSMDRARAEEGGFARASWEAEDGRLFAVDRDEWFGNRWPGFGIRGTARRLGELMSAWLPSAGGPAWRDSLLRNLRRPLADPLVGGAPLGWGFGVCDDGTLFGLPSAAPVYGQTGVNMCFALADPAADCVLVFLSTKCLAVDEDWRRKRRLVHAFYEQYDLRPATEAVRRAG